MRFLVLATDYDGTLAVNGRVAEPVWMSIRRLRESGRRAILVTGRELEELKAICPNLELFDRVVAENGALLYNPATKEIRQLCEPPPPRFAANLRALGIAPLSAGHVIVATVKPFENAFLEVISELGLEMQVIFNQESVMALPSGVNKATGLAAALAELNYSPHNVVGIGDAENDHALLTACECGVAVGNAVAALRERADIVMTGGPGAAVVELIEQILADDLEASSVRITRHDIRLGMDPDGRDVRLTPDGKCILIAGTSGSGKSTMSASLLEQLTESGYQFTVIDPEGDYSELPGAVVLGSPEHAPVLDESLNLVESGRDAVISLLGIPLADRPSFFDRLFPRLVDLRGRIGRPHWIAVDETHHLMPKSWTPSADRIPSRLRNLVLITVHPGSVSPEILKKVDVVLVLGQSPAETMGQFCSARQIATPAFDSGPLEFNEAIAYFVGSNRGPFKLTMSPPRSEQRRHRRKYAQGRLPEARNFIFTGSRGKLQLRAYNLVTFLELAAGVDDSTWLHHLKKGEYSKWFRDAIKDVDLARDAAAIESSLAKDATMSREAIRKAIEARYTLPAEAAASE
jgi:hydroxymethylpyrimidine pyrophosphatase-like HAD family hydrolase/energy-coupling factor transporter ATP-binding protein EcfA2